MRIPKLLKHYKILVTKLLAILKQNNVSGKIRFVKHIPEEWIPILSKETATRDLKTLTDLELIQSSGKSGAGAFYVLN